MAKLHSQVLLFILFGSVCNILHASPNSANAPQQGSPTKGSATTPAAQDAPADDKDSLSDAIIQDVLDPVRTGMETQNIRQVLSAFDRKDMSGYSDLEQQLHAFFRQFEQVRFRYQILQAAVEDTADQDRATATAEMDMDAMPFSVTQMAVRRSVQMHFRLKREAKGWKVLSFSPSDFFDVEYAGQ